MSRELSGDQLQLPQRRPRLAAARADDGRARAARRPPALRRGRGRRRRARGRDRDGLVAGRRIDAHAGDARLARRNASARCGSPTPFRASRRSTATSPPAMTSSADLAGCDFLAVPLDDVQASFARFGLTGGRDLRPGVLRGHAADPAGAAVGDRAAGRRQLRRHPAARWTRCIRTWPGAATSSSTTTSRSTSAARRSMTFAASTGSPSRSSTSTGAACAGGARASPRSCPWRRPPRPRPPRPRRPVRPRLPLARWRANPHQRVPAVEEMALRHEVAELRAQLDAAQREIQRAEVAPAACGAGVGQPPPAGSRADRSLIAFGSAITDPDAYRRYAEPGIKLVAEPDSVVFANAPGGLAVSCLQPDPRPRGAARRPRGARARPPGRRARGRGLLRQAAGRPGRSGGRRRRLRRRDRRAEHRLVGGVGDVGLVHPPLLRARRRRPARLLVERDELPPYARTGEVDTVDGFILGLSPWVVRNVRFDESLGALHGYDFDFCLQVREAGRKVVTADFKAIHHHSLDLIQDPEGWIAAHMRVAEKWDGRMPNVGVAGGDWKHRARRAEAEAGRRRRPGGGQPSEGRRARARAGARARDHEDEHRLADDRAAAAGQLLAQPLGCAAPGRQRRGLAPVLRQQSRISSLENAGSPRWRRRERATASANVPDCTSLRSRASLRALSSAHHAARACVALPGRRGGARGWPPAAPASDCGPTGRRSARSASAYGASRDQRMPSPKNAGTIANADLIAAIDEVLDRGQHAVARAALLRSPPIGR